MTSCNVLIGVVRKNLRPTFLKLNWTLGFVGGLMIVQTDSHHRLTGMKPNAREVAVLGTFEENYRDKLKEWNKPGSIKLKDYRDALPEHEREAFDDVYEVMKEREMLPESEYQEDEGNENH